MTKPGMTDLGRRERQIMDAVYRLGRASVGEVRRELADPPTYSSVRGMLGLLEAKGLLRHEREGLKYVYLPIVAPEKQGVSALRHLVRTFFGGSSRDAMAALLEDSRMTKEELDRLSRLVASARSSRKQGK